MNDSTTLGTWRAASCEEVVSLLATFDAPWWIAGGVAIDLFVGRSNRIHKDIDVGILRRDVDRLRRALPHWEIFEARSGSLLPLGADPHPATNSLWCRGTTTSPWSIEVLLDHADGSDWVFRRSPAIRRPLSGIMRWTGDGVPYLAPEIQLLYKSKAIRPRDQADFERTVPKLDAGARQWLCTALRAMTPDHVWLTACEG